MTTADETGPEQTFNAMNRDWWTVQVRLPASPDTKRLRDAACYWGGGTILRHRYRGKKLLHCPLVPRRDQNRAVDGKCYQK